MTRRHFTDAELFDLMDHLPDVTEHVHRSRQMTRSSMQHIRRIASICKAPAGFGEWGAEMSTMKVEEGMELVHRAWYHQMLQNKADKEKARMERRAKRSKR